MAKPQVRCCPWVTVSDITPNGSSPPPIATPLGFADNRHYVNKSGRPGSADFPSPVARDERAGEQVYLYDAESGAAISEEA